MAAGLGPVPYAYDTEKSVLDALLIKRVQLRQMNIIARHATKMNIIATYKEKLALQCSGARIRPGFRDARIA